MSDIINILKEHPEIGENSFVKRLMALYPEFTEFDEEGDDINLHDEFQNNPVLALFRYVMYKLLFPGTEFKMAMAVVYDRSREELYSEPFPVPFSVDDPKYDISMYIHRISKKYFNEDFTFQPSYKIEFASGKETSFPPPSVFDVDWRARVYKLDKSLIYELYGKCMNDVLTDEDKEKYGGKYSILEALMYEKLKRDRYEFQQEIMDHFDTWF